MSSDTIMHNTTIKVVGNLTANIVSETDGTTNRSFPVIVDEPVPGFLRQVKLSTAGLTIQRNATAIRIPLTELLQLAASLEPALDPNPQTPSAD